MKRILLMAVCLMAMATAAMAQDINDRAAYYFNIDHDLWYNSSNAAGLALGNMAQWRNVALGYDMATGSFTDSWDARSKSVVSASGDMLMDIEGFKVAARLDMGLGRLAKSRYNNSLYEVSWDMPYFVDINSDESFLWRQSRAALDVSAATPLLLDDRLSAGINLKMDLRGASKNAIPNGKYRGMQLEIMPSATFAINDDHTVGLALGYKLNPARSLVGGATASGVLVLQGLGSASPRIAGGDFPNKLGELDYNAVFFAAAVDYNYKGDASDWLVELTFDKGATRVTEVDKAVGRVDKILTGFSAAGLLGDQRSRKISLDILYNLNYWLEGSMETPKGTNSQLDADLGYTAYTDADLETGFDWVFGLGTEFHLMNYKRFFPEGNLANTRLMPYAFLGKNVSIAPEQSLLARLNLGYNFAAKTKYDYKGTTEGNYIVNYMYDKEVGYLGSYYLRTSLEAEYTYRFNSLLTPYASLGTTLLTPMGKGKGSRFLLSLRLGVLF
ncbi:MAG: hypothetical protein II963_03700 [Bacteroidales bacterium]|nr:hypothetical protein [Bacteroidales bacterium]